jgi:hypothetical protein
MLINKYSQQEYQIILDNYDHSLSMRKNAELIVPMLSNRNQHSLQMKFTHMKRKGLLDAVVAQEAKIEKDFYSRLADLITQHASNELKEKIFISILSS